MAENATSLAKSIDSVENEVIKGIVESAINGGWSIGGWTEETSSTWSKKVFSKGKT